MRTRLVRKHVNERTRVIIGLGATIAGVIVAIVGGVFVHMAEAPEFNEFGQEIFAGFPRGWVVATIAQIISLTGFIMILIGMTFGFVYQRTLTWARAMLGSLLFTGLTFILFAIIPNQMLTLFQATLEWTPQKIFFTFPRWLTLGSEISISYAALKDMIVAGYVTTMLIVLPIVMWQMQGRAMKADEPKPEPVSRFGRPMRDPRKAAN